MGTNYYARTKPCGHCGRTDEMLHIGKSFKTVRAHEQHDITSFTDWRHYLLRADVEVWDEYGRRVEINTREDLVDWLARWQRYESPVDWIDRDPYARTYMAHGDWLDRDGYHMCASEFS